MEVLTESRRRNFLQGYKGNDPKILEQRKLQIGLEEKWDELYNRAGKKSSYRDRWNKRQTWPNRWNRCPKDEKAGFYGASVFVEPNENYVSILEEKQRATYIAHKWESTNGKSMADLNEIKAAWDREKAAWDRENGSSNINNKGKGKGKDI